MNKRPFYLITFNFITVIVLVVLLQSCTSSGGSDIKSDNPESAYMIAKSRYDKKDYIEAIEDFNLLKLKFSGTAIIDKAVYYLGMSYYKQEEYILAIYEFETMIKNYPTSSFAEDSRYMLAMCYYKLSPAFNLDQTYTGYAMNEFQNFIELYPSSKYKTDVEKKMKELKNKLAYKALKNAEMYFNLDNYKSAIVYYDNVLEEYFETEYADDALYGKIQSLIKKKNYAAAREEIERFEKKFPTSSLKGNVFRLKSNLPR